MTSKKNIRFPTSTRMGHVLYGPEEGQYNSNPVYLWLLCQCFLETLIRIYCLSVKVGFGGNCNMRPITVSDKWKQYSA